MTTNAWWSEVGPAEILNPAPAQNEFPSRPVAECSRRCFVLTLLGPVLSSDAADCDILISGLIQNDSQPGGVPQGSALTPLLFTIPTQAGLREVFRDIHFQVSSSIWTSVQKFSSFNLLTPKPAENYSVLKCWCESKMFWEGSPAWVLFLIRCQDDQHRTSLPLKFG